MVSRKAFLLVCLGGLSPTELLAQSVPPPGDQVSADCNAPTYATDQLVCADAVLRAMDTEMLHLWTQEKTGGHLVEADLAAQQDWFRQRSLCAFKADHRACTIEAYHARIAALRNQFGPP